MIKTLDYQKAIKEGIVGQSGTVYLLESELSVARYAKLQEYMIEVATGLSAQQFIMKVQGAYEDLQHPKIMDAGKKLRDILEGASKVGQLYNPAQKAVALLFNSKEDTLEDRLAFDESKLLQKIDDWSIYGVSGFFQLLIISVPGLRAKLSENLDLKTSEE